MKDSLIEGLNRRFDIELNQNYSVATILDPRFKDIFFTDNNKNAIRENLIAILLKDNVDVRPEEPNMQNVVELEYSSSESDDDIPLNSLIARSKKKMKSDISIWDMFSSIASASTSNSSSKILSKREILQTEIDTYLKLPIIDRTLSPFDWWQANQNSFPHLLKAMKQYLSAPASTIFSERLFSEAGNVFETKRNALKPENGEKLIYLHHNLPLLNYKY